MAKSCTKYNKTTTNQHIYLRVYMYVQHIICVFKVEVCNIFKSQDINYYKQTNN